MKHSRKEILTLINAIRDSNPNAVRLYTEGQCFTFACILRSQFKGGEFWYQYEVGHMYYKYGDYWYDIRGCCMKCPDKCVPYCFKEGDPAYRWGRRDKRVLLNKGEYYA